MERDNIIGTARKLTTRLNELHKALAELGVVVDVQHGQRRIHCVGDNRVPEIVVSVAYTQTL